MSIRQKALKLTLLMALVSEYFTGAAPSQTQRARVGLVLSGEGLASMANIGVIKALEQLRIPIDVIVGTNMGAVIGGAYASGTAVAELEAIFEATDWRELLADAPAAYYLSGFCRRAPAADLRCRDAVGRASLLATPGLVSGRNLDLLLQALIVRAPAKPVYDFDRLPIPFRYVATDLATFDRIVMTSGNLASALRPSLVALDPVAIIRDSGRTIGDVPGLTRSVAIDIARQVGADVLIVVSVQQELSEPWRGTITDRESLLRAVLGGYSLLQTQESFQKLTNDDFILRPDTYAIAGSASGMGQTAKYIDAGFAATVRETRLKQLALVR